MCAYKLVVIVQGHQLIIQVLFQKGDVYATNVVCFKHCSTTQSMLLVIMDISSIMMTFTILFYFMTLLGLRTTDKYLHTGM